LGEVGEADRRCDQSHDSGNVKLLTFSDWCRIPSDNVRGGSIARDVSATLIFGGRASKVFQPVA
jgi:hypothetical protein